MLNIKSLYQYYYYYIHQLIREEHYFQTDHLNFFKLSYNIISFSDNLRKTFPKLSFFASISSIIREKQYLVKFYSLKSYLTAYRYSHAVKPYFETNKIEVRIDLQ